MSNLYNPAVTGLMLTFALTWFVISSADGNGEADLSDGVVFGIAVVTLSGLFLGVLAVIIGVVYATGAYASKLFRMGTPIQIETPWELFGPAFSGFVNGFNGTIEFVIGFFRWVPIEVAAVIFALAFLMIVTNGSDYATS